MRTSAPPTMTWSEGVARVRSPRLMSICAAPTERVREPVTEFSAPPFTFSDREPPILLFSDPLTSFSRLCPTVSLSFFPMTMVWSRTMPSWALLPTASV